MEKNIAVKKSEIVGKGVFAMRDFKKGELVLKLEHKELTKREAESVPINEAHYLWHVGRNKYFLIQPPARYVNHSCDANTTVRKGCDIAKCDIKKGEEITSNYARAKVAKRTAFVCKCGSKNCKGIVK